MTDDTDIHELDEDTVARIAAGEVVERPASAVKELVENSLDAGAETVDVEVEAGGTDLIRVVDDGRGMTEADLRAAVRQHTTSKISGLEDLESGVATLGFRGEALHTIGSVSKTTIRSRPRTDADAEAGESNPGAADVGTELVYEGGAVVSVDPAGCPEGTVVEVADLFFNTPARRKFLKTTATEFAHVNRVVTRYALANPDVAVSLAHDGREVFATTGQGDLQAAVLSVYGREVASSMIPVDADGEDLPPGPLASVSGLVSHPETNRSTREYLSTYVNGRAVTADAVREGIMGAYGTQLGGDRYPFVVLFLDVPGEAVDVNVHPRKREVRFDDDDSVRRQVDAAVESALLDHGLLRSRAPRGRSAPGEARIAPGDATPDEDPADGRDAPEPVGSTAPDSDEATAPGDGAPAPDPSARAGSDSKPTTVEGDRTADADAAEGADGGSAVASAADADATGSNAGPAGAPSNEDPSAVGADASMATSNERAAAPGDRADAAPGESERATTSAAPGKSERVRPTDGTGDSERPESGESDHERPTDGTRADEGDRRRRDPDRKFDVTTEQRTLAGEAATGERTEYESLPPLRVLGQLADTYVVCETPDGLALIDQHAADERVNYERLQAAVADDPAAQALASPVELEVTAAEAEAFASYREALARLGFYADRTGDRTVSVTTVPAVLDETLEPERLRDVLTSVVAGDREAGAETVDALADEFLGDLACYPSITGNTSLTEGSVVELLEALDDCENPYACPHGRPVIVHVDAEELEARFERDYPGHQG